MLIRPKFPLYIPTKGRSQYMLTSRALDQMGVPHRLVVEEAEYPAYLEAVEGDRSKLLVLDQAYKASYELCDALGLSKSTGPGPARNFIWEHSIAEGHEWHWVMDDNIRAFYRLNHNLKVPTTSPAFWAAMEDFALRYSNVGMAGPNYFMFASRKSRMPPFVANTRIYSCNLIRNDLPFRWRGRYNEDTILSLDMLKAGWATIQFNAFLQEKTTTQTIGGGNTAEFYAAEGTLAKSRMLVAVHPDCSQLAVRWGRAHHYVDYGRFKDLKLLRRPDLVIPEGPNEYGMKLVQVEGKRPRGDVAPPAEGE